MTRERILAIKSHPVTYDEDSPKLTAEQIAGMRPAHRAYWKVEPIKEAVSIKIDADVLAWFKAEGKGYQTRINKALREAMMRSGQ